MADEDKRLRVEKEIITVLRSIYDPEIPVNIYELGLIYEIDLKDDWSVDIEMTLTAPNCPVADDLVMQVRDTVADVPGIKGSNVNLVFEPPWDPSLMSEEAKLELGML